MSGAGATSRVRATAGVATVWGRALRAELVKVVTLPAMWWSAAVAGGAAVATMVSVLRDVVAGRGLGFEEVAPVWALAVQIGFVAAGVAAAGAEHSTAQGMTSLLVTPTRGRLAAARLMVLTGTGLVAASVLVGASLAACPTMSTAALWAGGRTVVWLTAVLLLSAGLGAALRSVIGASTATVVLVILAPQLAVFLGAAARWLPGQAAQIWLTADASRADVTSSGLIILAWTTAAQAAGIVRLVRADGEAGEQPPETLLALATPHRRSSSTIRSWRHRRSSLPSPSLRRLRGFTPPHRPQPNRWDPAARRRSRY